MNRKLQQVLPPAGAIEDDETKLSELVLDISRDDFIRLMNLVIGLRQADLCLAPPGFLTDEEVEDLTRISINLCRQVYAQGATSLQKDSLDEIARYHEEAQ